MNLRRFFVLGGVLGMLFPCAAGTSVIMDHDFEEGFQPGILRDGKTPRGAYYVRCGKEGASIVKDQSQVLKIIRKESGAFIMPFPAQLQAGKNYRVSMKFKAPAKNHAVLFISNNGVPSSGLFLGGSAYVCAYDANKKWAPCIGTLPLAADKWSTINVDVNAAAKNYVVEVCGDDGKVRFSNTFPLLTDKLPNEIRFHNAHPAGSEFMVDDVKVVMFDRNSQNKDDLEYLQEGDLPARWRSNTGIWSNAKRDDMSQVDVVSDGEHGKVIRLIRKKFASELAFYPYMNAAGENVRAAVDLKLAPKSPIVLLLYSGRKIIGGVLVRGDGDINGYNAKRAWTSSGIADKFSSGKYANIAVDIDYGKNSYSVSFDGAKGIIDHPLLEKGTLTHIVFVISHPLESTAWIDNMNFESTGKSTAALKGGNASGKIFNIDFNDFAEGVLPGTGRLQGVKYAASGSKDSFQIVADNDVKKKFLK